VVRLHGVTSDNTVFYKQLSFSLMACVVVYFGVDSEFSYIIDSHDTSEGCVLRVQQLQAIAFHPLRS
jgi:hypothetical protein